MRNNSHADFSDDLFAEQVGYLAENTQLGEKEAEAFLRYYLSDDETSNREIVEYMDISESTYSLQLQNSRDKISTETASIDVLKQLFTTTQFGGPEGPLSEIIAGKPVMNGFVLLSENKFSEYSDLHVKYKMYLVYRESTPEIDFENVPDGVHSSGKWAQVSFETEEQDALVEAAEFYVGEIDTFNDTDLINILKMLSKNGFDAEDVTSKVVKRFHAKDGGKR